MLPKPFHPSPTAVYLVVFVLVLNGLLLNAGAQPRPGTTTTPGTGVTLINPQTERRLTTDRISKLKQLLTISRVPVKVSLSDSSSSVELLQLNVPVATGTTAQSGALRFLNDYLGLIDPRILPGELQPSPGPDGSCAGGDTTFVRVVDGVPVAGGTITVRQAGGTIFQVENSLASVKGTIAPARMIANLTLHPLARDLRTNKKVDVAKLPQTKVLLPVEDRSGGHLKRAIAYLGSDGKDRASAFFYDVGSNKLLPGKWDLDPGGFGIPTARLPKYRLDPRTGVPIFITYRPVGGLVFPPAAALDPIGTVYSYFNTWPAVFRTGAPRCQFRVKSVVRYPYVRDTTFVRMEQIYVGLPVFGAELVFEIKNRTTVMSIMGHSLSNIYLDPVPRISSTEAIAKAKEGLDDEYRTLKIKGRQWETFVPQATLVVFPGELTGRGKLGTHLAYRVAAMDFYVFIDAHTGGRLYSIPRRHTELPGLNFSVNVAPAGADEYGRLSYTEFSRNGTPTGAAGTPDSTAATTLLPLVGAAYTTFGMSGINGNGLDYIANTDVALTIGCPNAFFTDLVNEAFFCTGVAPNDVVAHEFTHGVIAHSSGLVYQDESGALNESYADIMGNLIFPDVATLAPGVPSWLVGEAVVPGGPLRDMANPAVATLGAYRARNIGPGAGGCTFLASSCDAGFVHTNSGITNLAHVLLANGNAIPAASIAIAGVRPGIGRVKTRHLAFLTMTTRLTPWSHLVDSELGTHETAEMLQSLGAFPLLLAGEAPPGAFNQLDADVVPTFFAQVGLSADLTSGYASPQVGFSGTQTFFPGETTDSLCPVSNIRVKVETPSGDRITELVPPAAVNYFGVFGATVVPPGPVGTTTKTHTVTWFNIFGAGSPRMFTNVIADPPAGDDDCRAGLNIAVQRKSAIQTKIVPLAGFWTDVVGPTASTMNAACTLNKTEVELLKSSGTGILAGPGTTAHYDREECFPWPIGCKITGAQDASVTASPTAPPNLSTTISWSTWGYVEVRYRVVWHISQPPGITCTP